MSTALGVVLAVVLVVLSMRDRQKRVTRTERRHEIVTYRSMDPSCLVGVGSGTHQLVPRGQLSLNPHHSRGH